MTASDDEFTELYDATVPRVDLVGKGANGIPFLIAKSPAGALLSADVVRDLIKQAEPATPEEGTITMSGTPAAIAAMIAGAPVRKADPDTAERRHEAATGAAMPDGSYPIENKAQLSDAIHAVGRGKGSHDAIRRHIITRAKSLGASSEIPDDWNADGSIKKETAPRIAKADGVEPLPDADEVNTEIGDQLDGDPDDVDSPAWEAVDAARACQAIDLAVALKRMVCEAQDREQQEASLGADPDDAGNAMDLGDVLCAIDCIISVLAPFAVGEQAEADDRQADLDELTKGQVRKAGRVLSAVNEARIKAAHDALTDVLGSLPAPEPEITKEATVDESDIGKAKGDPQVAVYTADGKLVGVVDQADISPIAAPAAPAGGDEQGGSSDDSADTADTADDAPAATSPDGAAADAPASEADGKTIPGTDTVQAPAEAPAPDDDTDVTKTAVDALTEQLAAQAQLVKSMQERLDAFGLTPDDRNSPHLATAAGREPAAADDAADLAKQAAEATDPRRKQELSMAAAFAAVRKAQAGTVRKAQTMPNYSDVLARFQR